MNDKSTKRLINMRNKQQLFRTSRKIHKWVGLFIGIQVFFWIAGGLIMSSLPLEKVHGDHLHNKAQNSPSAQSDYLIPLAQVLNGKNLNPTLVKFYQIEQTPVYEIKEADSFIYSGITGDLMPELSTEKIEQLAKKWFTGSETIASVEKISQVPLEASRLKGPVWKVVFDDSIETTFYLHPVSGKLLTVRSNIWRLFDFVWMLHIMDYDTRDDFNNPLLITFAISALIFTISGMIILFQSFRRRDFDFLSKSKINSKS